VLPGNYLELLLSILVLSIGIISATAPCPLQLASAHISGSHAALALTITYYQSLPGPPEPSTDLKKPTRERLRYCEKQDPLEVPIYILFLLMISDSRSVKNDAGPEGRIWLELGLRDSWHRTARPARTSC
jgi:hypothetical protein